MTIGTNEDDERNAIGWGRTAIALRPNNPLAHYYYAVALSRSGRGDDRTTEDVENALEELRRTIELAPKFAKAHGLLAWVLYFHQDGDDAKALAAARTAIKFDDQNILGHMILYTHFLRQKAYRGAAREARSLQKLFNPVGLSNQPSERSTEALAHGRLEGSRFFLIQGLIDTGQPFEAYRIILESTHDGGSPGNHMFIIETPSESDYYLAARAAAMAGTAQGSDPPLPAEQPAIRKRALEWLNKGLEDWKREAAALPMFSAISVSLLGAPSGGGSLLLLATAAMLPVSPYSVVNRHTDREVIHQGMNHWLSDPDLARVREGAWLDKLPADVREQWREFWKNVRSLRDQTAPATTAPLPIREQ